jgi:lysophospholipase-2
MSSLVRFLFSLAAAIAVASLLAASLRHRAPPAHFHDQLVAGPMAARNRSFVLWLHGLGDSGPANEPIRTFFTAPEFRLTKWAFPSAPNAPVSCNRTPPSTLILVPPSIITSSDFWGILLW